MKHIKLEPIIAPTISAAISSQDQSLPSAHSSPYSLPIPAAKPPQKPANATPKNASSPPTPCSRNATATRMPIAKPPANVANRCLSLSLI